MPSLFNVQVQPKAKARGVEGLADGSYKVRTNVAPEDGKANADVIEQLAEHLGVAKSRLSVVRGATGRKKVISIS
jgi:uncharacterized protein (TIGR00251 family)